MFSYCSSAWRAGLRSRSIQAVLIVGLLLVAVAYLSAAFSPRQPKTVALDVGLSGLRLSLVLFAILWVQELIGKEIERKTVFFALAYPVPRSHFLFGRFMGIASLLALATAILGLSLWWVVLVVGEGYEQGFAVLPGVAFWSSVAAVWLDALVVGAFALWIASFSTVASLPLLLSLALAMAGRSIGAVAEYLANAARFDTFALQFAPAIEAIQWLIPDLSRLDWRVWPMYGASISVEQMALACAMACGYILLLMALAAWSFSRREFT